MVRKYNLFKRHKNSKLTATKFSNYDEKYLSVETLIVQEAANFPGSIKPEPIVTGISEQTLTTGFINAFIMK